MRAAGLSAMARRHAVEQLPAFAAIAHDDRRGALWIAAILSLIFVAMTLGARLYVRKHMLGRDDFASMAAVALAVAQYASLFAGMPSGLGTSKLSVTQGNERKNGSVRFCPFFYKGNGVPGVKDPCFVHANLSPQNSYSSHHKPSLYAASTWPSLPSSWPRSACSPPA